MSCLCVITARGGSKRIPRKNIRDFCGKPIIAYSIEAAIDSGLFDEVMVSTDDAEIAEVAEAHGARVPFMRSAKTSDDFATTVDVLLEVIGAYEEGGSFFDAICCIYPTAPFVTAEKLHVAAEMLSDDVSAVLSTVRFSYPPQRGFVDGGHLRYWQPENEGMRSQDLDVVYHDAGQFYFRDVGELKRTKSLVGDMAMGFEVPETEAQDIDNLIDWELAEMKFERMVGLHG